MTANLSRDVLSQRIRHTGDRLIEAILMQDEAKMTEPIVGTSGYAKRFAAIGPKDNQGRSFRDLDLTTRMFKYPCSYLIYSAMFEQLPQPSKDHVLQRIWDVRSGKDQSEDFSHLSSTDRQAILKILNGTKATLHDYWKN